MSTTTIPARCFARSPRSFPSALATLLVAVLTAACDRAPAPYDIAELAAPSAEGSRFPFLATDTSGRTILTWAERESDSTAVIRFSERTPRGEWKRPFTLARDSALLLNWADFASVVPMDDGRLVGQWLRRGTQRHAYEMLLAHSVDGGDTWSAPVVPHARVRPGEHGFVSMFSMPGGGTGVQFLDGSHAPDSAPAMVLQHVMFDGSARVAGGHPLDERVCDCCQTDAAMTSRGPVVVYRDRSPEEIRDIAVVRRVDGAWTAPARVHTDDWKIEGCPVNGPAIAAGGDLVAVAWYTAARDTARVRLAFSRDAGATFGPPVELDSGVAALGRVDLAILPSGGALVTWLHRASRERASVRLAAVASDGRIHWTGVAGETDATRSSGFPRMTRAGDVTLLAYTEVAPVTRVRVFSVTAR